jgi:hypothetical protein
VVNEKIMEIFFDCVIRPRKIQIIGCLGLIKKGDEMENENEAKQIIMLGVEKMSKKINIDILKKCQDSGNVIGEGIPDSLENFDIPDDLKEHWIRFHEIKKKLNVILNKYNMRKIK